MTVNMKDCERAMTDEADEAVVAFGFRHRAAAGTRISSNGNGVVVAPGELGEIDFSIETGKVQGIIPEFDVDPAALDDGAGVQSTTLGIAESGEEIVTGRLGMHKRGSWLTVTPDFREVGADSYELVLFREGKVVWRQAGLQGEAGNIGVANRFAAGNCCRVAFYSIVFGTAPFEVADGPQIEADTAYFIPENREVPTAITGLRVHATGMNELRMARLSIALFDPFVMYSGIGDIALTPGDDGLTMHVGRDDDGALDVTCGDVDECALTLEFPEWANNREITVTGRVDGRSDRAVTFRVPLAEGRRSEAAVSGIGGPGAGIRLGLPPSSRTLVAAERIQARPGAPDTLQGVQAELRGLARGT